MMCPLGWWSRLKSFRSELKSENGVLTVEGLLILPVMFLGLLWLVAIIQAAGQWQQIDHALYQVVREISNAAYTVQQSVGLLSGENSEGVMLPEPVTMAWAEASLKKHLPDYERIKPALTWQEVQLPSIDKADEGSLGFSSEEVMLNLVFQPAQVDSAVSRLLPNSLSWQLIKVQKSWLIGRGLLPYRGLEQSAAAAKSGEIVYVTRWGTRYHQDGCRYLAKSKIMYELADLPDFYRPCQVCRP
jgi:hypothetical protein